MKLRYFNLFILITLGLSNALIAMQEPEAKDKGKEKAEQVSTILPPMTLKFSEGSIELDGSLAGLCEAFKTQYGFNERADSVHDDAFSFDLSQYSKKAVMSFVKLLALIKAQGNVPICCDIKELFSSKRSKKRAEISYGEFGGSDNKFVDQSAHFIKLMENQDFQGLFELGEICSQVGAPKKLVQLCSTFIVKKFGKPEEFQAYAQSTGDAGPIVLAVEFSKELFEALELDTSALANHLRGLSLEPLLKLVYNYMTLNPSEHLSLIFAEIVAEKLVEDDNLLAYVTDSELISMISKYLDFKDLHVSLHSALKKRCATLLWGCLETLTSEKSQPIDQKITNYNNYCQVGALPNLGLSSSSIIRRGTNRILLFDKLEMEMQRNAVPQAIGSSKIEMSNGLLVHSTAVEYALYDLRTGGKIFDRSRNSDIHTFDFGNDGLTIMIRDLQNESFAKDLTPIVDYLTWQQMLLLASAEFVKLTNGDEYSLVITEGSEQRKLLSDLFNDIESLFINRYNVVIKEDDQSNIAPDCQTALSPSLLSRMATFLSVFDNG